MNICIVNNYNYAPFLEDALESVLQQTRKFDRVIVVDDGSTDSSMDIIRRYEIHSGWVVVSKKNGGQLSAFNFALPWVEDDARVYFLDSDDFYPPDYLEIVSNTLASRSCPDAFVFCDSRIFRGGNEIPASAGSEGDVSALVVPCTSALTRHIKFWVGNITSSISMRGWLLKQILPCPHERDWVSRADDVLVFGASVFGVEKTQLSGIHVNYRVHSSNAFFGRELPEGQKLQRQVRLERLFFWLCARTGLSPKAALSDVLQELAALPPAWFVKAGLSRRRIFSMKLWRLLGAV